MYLTSSLSTLSTGTPLPHIFPFYLPNIFIVSSPFFFCNPLSLFSAASMNLGVGPFTGMWVTYQGPISKGNSLFFPGSHHLPELRLGPWDSLVYMCWRVGCFELALVPQPSAVVSYQRSGPVMSEGTVLQQFSLTPGS